jgi:hypothetical protein
MIPAPPPWINRSAPRPSRSGRGSSRRHTRRGRAESRNAADPEALDLNRVDQESHGNREPDDVGRAVDGDLRRDRGDAGCGRLVDQAELDAAAAERSAKGSKPFRFIFLPSRWRQRRAPVPWLPECQGAYGRGLLPSVTRLVSPSKPAAARPRSRRISAAKQALDRTRAGRDRRATGAGDVCLASPPASTADRILPRVPTSYGTGAELVNVSRSLAPPDNYRMEKRCTGVCSSIDRTRRTACPRRR